MSDLKLSVYTQGVRGGKGKSMEQGYSLLTCYESGHTIAQVSIDTFEGTGKNYKERESFVVDISFRSIDGEMHFRGTLKELQEKLFPK